jgi:hypothetical protein
MSQPNIPSPGELSEVPDKYTKSYDYTGTDAPHRVLHLNFGFFKYGTNDKAHAAAIVLSIVLLIVTLFLVIIGMFAPNAAFLEKVVTWLWNGFLFVAGVAVGHGGGNKGSGS